MSTPRAEKNVAGVLELSMFRGGPWPGSPRWSQLIARPFKREAGSSDAGSGSDHSVGGGG